MSQVPEYSPSEILLSPGELRGPGGRKPVFMACKATQPGREVTVTDGACQEAQLGGEQRVGREPVLSGQRPDQGDGGTWRSALTEPIIFGGAVLNQPRIYDPNYISLLGYQFCHLEQK